MKNLSIEQFEKLKKYEPLFRSAVYSKYLRGQTHGYYADLVQVCGELGIRINLNCPACVLNAVTQLGRMFFDMAVQQKTEQPATADSSVIADKAEPKKTTKTSSKTPDKAKNKSNKTNKKTK